MSKRVVFGLVLGILCLAMPRSSRADTIYSYTGDYYNSCTGLYSGSVASSCAGNYQISFTFTTTLSDASLENLTWGTGGNGFIYPSVSSFGISDGARVAIFFGDSGVTATVFDIGTDANGNITTWSIEFSRLVGSLFAVGASTEGIIGSQLDASSTSTVLGFGSGVANGTAGSWTKTEVPGTGATDTPEPSTWLVLGIGLTCVAAISILRKRDERSAQPLSPARI